MREFPEAIRIKLGIYVEIFIEWLREDFSGFFDAIKSGILWFLMNVQDILLFIPWWLIIIGVVLLATKVRNVKSGVFYGFLIFLIGAFGLWEMMILTLAVVLTSVVISLLVGIPIGIVMAYSDKLEVIIKPLLDAMQTMPSFVYLIPAIMFFDLGTVPAVFATTIYSVPPVIRLTNLAIRRVPKEVLEAAKSFGSSPMQTLIKVELPQAMPTIMAGINQTTMMAMAMVVISSMIGAKGLGINVLTAINRIDIAMGFEAGVSIVILAIIIDRITQSAADKFKYPE
ncbi:MAG: proline/glycine betaine ABC transporter permease [Firmicutes bacterium]|nr:proline/glycine betaine ABC transporter permease [Bacillota bacterium]